MISDDRRILLIDDGPVFRLFLEHILEIEERILLATSEDEAITYVSQHNPILVIVNLDAASIPAFELSRTLREHHAEDFGAMVAISSSNITKINREVFTKVFDKFSEPSTEFDQLRLLIVALLTADLQSPRSESVDPVSSSDTIDLGKRNE